MSDSSTLVVTGAAGFIGSQVANILLQRGNRVVGIDNLNDYYDPAIKTHRLSPLRQHPSFHFHVADISDRFRVAEILDQHPVDVVINLAARAGVRYSMDNPHVYMQSNADANLCLLEEMQKRQIQKYILASTSSLYAGQAMPFLETLPVNTPISPYAATKKAAEVMAYTYHSLYQIDVSIVRYFTVYGPAGRPDMSCFRFIYCIDNGIPLKLFGDGEQARDFTYVDDIALGTIAAIKKVGYEIINLGGGNQPYSINDLISRIENQLGKKAIIDRLPAHVADMKTTWANIDKAKDLLGWSPKISLDDGLDRSIKWYLDNRDWLVKLPNVCDTA